MRRARAAGRVLAAHRAPLVAVAVVTFVTTVLGALVFPVLGLLATAGTRYDLDDATTAERDLQVRYTVAEPGAGDPQAAFDGIAAALADARSGMPDLLRSAVGPGEYFAQTDPLPLAAEPSKVPAYVSLTADPGFVGRSHMVSGREPRAAEGDQPVEVVVSRSVADAIGWPVGTSRTAESAGGSTTLTLVGVYAADDPSADAWEQTPATLRRALTGTSTGGTAVLGAAYVAPGSFGTVATGRATTGRAWFPLRIASVRSADRAALAEQTRQALGRTTPLPSTATGSTRITTGLPELLDAAAARDASVRTLAAALGSGPLVAVLGVQVLLARITVERDRDRWRLLAARGADRTLRSTLAAGMVAVAAVPAAALAAVVARVVAALAGLAPGPVTTLGAVALVGAVVPSAAAAVLVPGPARTTSRRSPRPLVEGAVLVVTAVAVVVSVRSGIGTAAPDGRVDPLAAVLPALLAGSVTVVAVRVLPRVLRGVVRRARARPGLTRFLGSVTAARTDGTRTVALAVAVAGIAVALFGSVVGSTLEHGLGDAARRSVAADLSVESPGLDAGQVDRIARVPGVAAAVGVATSAQVTLSTATDQVTATLVVADTERLGAVQAGVPGALPVPRALRGTDARGVPLVVSASLASDLRRTAEVDRTRVRVVGTAPDPTSFTGSTRWALVDTRYADELTSTGSVDRVLVRLRDGADAGRVAASLGRAVDDVTVRTSASVARDLTADPRLPGVRGIALVAAVLGAVVGAGALALAGVLAGARRRLRGRLLTTLGLDDRRDRRLVAAEAVPVLVTALATAVVAAAAIVAVTLPAADLRSFTAGPVRPPVSVDPLSTGATLLGVAGALLLVLAVEVAAGTERRRRVRGRRRPGHGRHRAAPPHRRPPNRSRP